MLIWRLNHQLSCWPLVRPFHDNPTAHSCTTFFPIKRTTTSLWQTKLRLNKDKNTCKNQRFQPLRIDTSSDQDLTVYCFPYRKNMLCVRIQCTAIILKPTLHFTLCAWEHLALARNRPFVCTPFRGLFRVKIKTCCTFLSPHPNQHVQLSVC